jgi:hypothetical protein
MRLAEKLDWKGLIYENKFSVTIIIIIIIKQSVLQQVCNPLQSELPIDR